MRTCQQPIRLSVNTPALYKHDLRRKNIRIGELYWGV